MENKKKILIVASNYYNEITHNLVTGASDYLEENKISFDSKYITGSFEIPFLFAV